MVSMEQTGSKIHHSSIYRFHSPSSTHLWREIGRSKRTIRSNLYSGNQSSAASFAVQPDSPTAPSSENLSDSSVDLHLSELAASSRTGRPSLADDDFLALTLSHSSFNSDYTACGSDISGELHRLATVAVASETAEEDKDKSSGTPCSSTTTSAQNPNPNNPDQSPEPGGRRGHGEHCGLPAAGFLLSDSFSPEEVEESMSPEDLQPTVHTCVEVLLHSPSSLASSKRSAAAMLRLLAKNHSDNRVLIANSGAVPALVPLLRCSDPAAQEHAVTALLNLSLHPANKAAVVGAAGAVKSLIYVLKTGTDVAKQNAAAALMSLAMVEENRLTIGACGAIPPLVALLVGGTARGKKDALTTLYKLCTARQNKERAVRAGAVGPLVKMVVEEVVVVEEGGGMVAEKAMVVLTSLTGIKEGKEAIVEEGGIGALVEAVEDSSDKGKEFAVLTLLQLCVDSVKNRGLLIREGGIPPLVGLSQTGTTKAKHKAETLLGYLRESRQEAVAATSTP